MKSQEVAGFRYLFVPVAPRGVLVAVAADAPVWDICRVLVMPLQDALVRTEKRWWRRWVCRLTLLQLRRVAFAVYKSQLRCRLSLTHSPITLEGLALADSFADAVETLPLFNVLTERTQAYPKWTSLLCCWRGCSATYIYSTTLNEHIRREHLGLGRQCELCGASLRRVSNLAQHQRSERCLRRCLTVGWRAPTGPLGDSGGCGYVTAGEYSE